MIQIPVEPAITEYLHRKATIARIPLSGTFELTPVCNMNCKMCYVRMSKQQQEAIRPLRTAEEWLALAETAKKAGLLYLLITGGEPFLHPQIRQILTGLHAMGFVVTINSNGTMIDEETVAWLKTVPPMRVNVTLYGASDETYDRLCGNPKGFTQVTRGIRLLREAGITAKINCSVTPYNAPDLEAIMEYVKQQNLLISATSYMFPPLRKDPHMVGRNDRFTPREAAFYAAKIEYLVNGEERFLSKAEEEIASLPGETDDNCADAGDTIRCRAGKCSFWVTWQGNMMPCGMFPDLGDNNVFESDFHSAWDRVKQASDAIRLPAKCASCGIKDACKACAAMVLTESGCFDKVPEYRCEMAQVFPAMRLRLKEEILKRGREK